MRARTCERVREREQPLGRILSLNVKILYLELPFVRKGSRYTKAQGRGRYALLMICMHHGGDSDLNFSAGATVTYLS